MRFLRTATILGVLAGIIAPVWADAPHVLFLIGEREYGTRRTLPDFAKQELAPLGCRSSFVFSGSDNRTSPECHQFPGLEQALGTADLLLISVRRRYPPRQQLDLIRKWVAGGKPIVAIRTSSHAFSPSGGDVIPDGHATWPAFDRDVLGVTYEGHYGNKVGDKPTEIWQVKGLSGHPIAKGIRWDGRQAVDSHLYKSRNLADAATILLQGQVKGEGQIEPVAWTYNSGKSRVFYTSLGSVDDLQMPAVRRMLVSAIYWGLDLQTPAPERTEKAVHIQNSRSGGLPPTEALKKLIVADDLALDLVLHEPQVRQPVFLNFDERGRMWVVQYQQYPHPAGLRIISHDKVWRNVYDKVPQPPGHPDHVPGRDKITIHEDTDGDGIYDLHKTFVDGLNMATAVARGRGGAWVLNPPYLLFYPDRDGDDEPDRDPEVHLQGFGLEDSHSLVNSLRWGPDGWLYAAQGSTVSGNIMRPGIDEQPVFSQGQLIWRYHPETHRYEIFAEGGGNTFGVEVDAKGRLYSGTNEGDLRGYHYVQGSYARKNFGKHGELSNPYAYGFFPGMRHHKVKRFTHTFVVYEAQDLPPAYRGKLLGVHPLESHVVMSDIEPDGSTFRTRDVATPLTSKDEWFRPVDIKSGPDGALYVADWYDGQINHWQNHQGLIDPSNGRVYRLRSREATFTKPADLSKRSSVELVELLRDENKWVRQTALRLLGDRKDKTLVPQLKRILAESIGQTALEALWALNVTTGLDESTARTTLRHSDPYVRVWTVRLLCDDRRVSSSIAQRMAELAATEPHVEVRSQLACSARRLPTKQALPILQHLLARDADADDLHLPLLLWWAVETMCRQDFQAVISALHEGGLWQRKIVLDHVLQRLMQRFATQGRRKDLLICATLFESAPDEACRSKLMSGFEAAFRGRSVPPLPAALAAQLAARGGGSLELQVRRGDESATRQAITVVSSRKADRQQRQRYARLLGEVKAPRAIPVLLDVALHGTDADVRRSALAALCWFEDERISRQVIQMHDQLPSQLQPLAQILLAGRVNSAHDLIKAMDQGVIRRDLVALETIDALRQLRDEQLRNEVRQRWGEITTDDAQIEAAIDRYDRLVKTGSADLQRGREVFRQTCAKCHILHNEGGKVGPDLTSYNRGNTRSILLAVVRPSVEIREGFLSYVALTDAGRVITGLMVDEDERIVVLRGHDGTDVALERESLEDLLPNKTSLMPDGLLEKMTDQQVRDLMAYLQTTQPIK